MSEPKVLVFGDINVDNIFSLTSFPDPGRDAYAEHVEMHLGGAACNSAVQLACIGQATRLFGALGDDFWSHYVLAELETVKLDSSFLVTKAGKQTGLIFIAVTPNGERTMLSYRGANLDIQPGDLTPTLLDGISLVQLIGYDFLISPQKECAWMLVEMSRADGIPISMDTGLDPVILQRETIMKVIPHLAVLITGGVEAQKLTGVDEPQQQLDQFLSFGLEQVAVKLGHKGAWLGTPAGRFSGPAFQVKVVDTTSAGDAFSAGLLYGYVHHFSPQARLLLANALGGLATTVFGAARFNRHEVLTFLENNMSAKQNPGYDEETFVEVMQGLTEKQ